MIMNIEEDFASEVGRLWGQWDEGEITRKQFNSSLRKLISEFLENDNENKKGDE